jgi:hypothetical protein
MRLLFLTVMPAALLAQNLSGVVRHAVDLTPLVGARVRIQASAYVTTTDASGAFQFTGVSGSNLRVVAAMKGFFNQGVLATPPNASIVLSLDPVPDYNHPSFQPTPPDQCGYCHDKQLAEWLGTPMSQAGRNLWVHDLYSGTGTAGGMGGFVYLRDSVLAPANPNSECASCHQPELWVNTPFSALNPDVGSSDSHVVHGVSCDVCHKIADMDSTKFSYPGIFPGALTFSRPYQEQVMYGTLGDVDFRMDGFMRASYQPMLEAEVCAACHQDSADPNNDHTFNGVVSEPTYFEWKNSPYGDPGSPHYASCVDCHMPIAANNMVCDVLSPTPPRSAERVRSHTIRGTSAEFLENAAQLSIQASPQGNELAVEVAVTNYAVGHHLPSGVTIRNLILLVEASIDGQPLSHVGSQVVHPLGGVGDPAQGYYAGLPGKLFAFVNHDASGNGPTFFTDATGILFDTRIPALTTDTTHYLFALPEGNHQVQLRARLIYRRSFRALVDAKGWTEDGHGNPLADLAAPHYGHLMEEAQTSVQVMAVPALGPGSFVLLTLLLAITALHFARRKASKLG